MYDMNSYELHEEGIAVYPATAVPGIYTYDVRYITYSVQYRRTPATAVNATCFTFTERLLVLLLCRQVPGIIS